MWESAIDGPAPAVWYGADNPNGDSVPFASVPVGTLYVQTGDNPRLWTKTADNQVDSDWSIGMGVLSQRVLFSDFTDGGAAVGTLDMDGSIPAGAYVLRVVVEDVVGFTGNVSANLKVGDGSDVDRYTTSSGVSLFTTIVALDGGAPSGTNVHVLAATPRLTVTSDSDFTAVAAGAATVKIFYMK
jgi:hypothetical protein